MIVEYVLITSNTGSFCRDARAILNLIQLDASLRLTDGRLHLGSEFSCRCYAESGVVEGKDQRYHHLRFDADIADGNSDGEVERYAALLRTVRGALSRLGDQLFVLRDDISSYYGRRAYPIIQDIENLMRQLIGNFMLINVGKEWVREAAPEVFRTAAANSKRKDELNSLRNVDFIHLSPLLLKPYALKETDELFATITKSSGPIDPADLADYVPKSNWQRYFASIVNCPDQYLETRWQQLYDLRCKVAHNVGLSKSEYVTLSRLVSELRPHLEEALQKLPQVKVPMAEREAVAENAASQANAIYGDYITAWRQFEGWVFAAVQALGHETKPPYQVTQLLEKANLLSNKDDCDLLRRLQHVRNCIVHHTEFMPTEDEVAILSEEIKSFRKRLPCIVGVEG